MAKFKFELKAAVTIVVSGEQGTIVARMESVNVKNQYLVSYKSADGRASEAWFYESDLKVTPAAKPTRKPATRKKAATKKKTARRTTRKPAMPQVPSA